MITNYGWSTNHEIDILAYSGLFIAEDVRILRVLTSKANVKVRIALGDPDSPHVTERGAEESIGEALAAKIRNALVLYRSLHATKLADLRIHKTVLYNSIYRADDATTRQPARLRRSRSTVPHLPDPQDQRQRDVSVLPG